MCVRPPAYNQTIWRHTNTLHMEINEKLVKINTLARTYMLMMLFRSRAHNDLVNNKIFVSLKFVLLFVCTLAEIEWDTRTMLAAVDDTFEYDCEFACIAIRFQTNWGPIIIITITRICWCTAYTRRVDSNKQHTATKLGLSQCFAHN